MPYAKGNIAETVGSIVLQQGRPSLLYSDGSEKSPTLAEMFRVSQEKMRVFTAAYELNTQEKRKGVGDEGDTQQGGDADESSPANNIQPFETAPSAKHGIKKHKAKLKNHKEPVPEDSHGIKRAATATDEDSSDSEIADDNEASSTYTNKKHKTEFGTHHESTFALIQGMKRKLEFPGPSWTHTRYPNATHVLVHLSSNRAHFFQFRQPLSSWCASVIKNLSLRMWTATSAVVAWGYSRVEKKWFT
jgi:hypothetical protein